MRHASIGVKGVAIADCSQLPPPTDSAGAGGLGAMRFSSVALSVQAEPHAADLKVTRPKWTIPGGYERCKGETVLARNGDIVLRYSSDPLLHG